MLSALEELAASIARVRELVADCLHDLDVGGADIRDGLEESRRRVDVYRARASGVEPIGWTDFSRMSYLEARATQFALSRSATRRVSRS